MNTILKGLLKNRITKLVIEVTLILLVFIIIKTWMQRSMIDGTPAPIQATTIEGQAFELEALKGKSVLVHFWATWCNICRLEQDSIDAISKTHTVITIAMKSGQAEKVDAYMQKNKLSYPVINDPEGEISRRYGVNAVPASFILNPQGEIAFRESGYTSNWGLRIRMWLAGLNNSSP